MGHLAGQRLKRSLRGGIGCPCKRVDTAASDGCDVHNRPPCRSQFILERAGQHHRREEIHMEHLAPGPQIRVEGVQSPTGRRLWRNAGIVDQRIQRLTIQAFAHNLHRCNRVMGVRKVHLDVILLPSRPRAPGIKGLAGTGQNAPPCCREFLHRGMADASARACQ